MSDTQPEVTEAVRRAAEETPRAEYDWNTAFLHGEEVEPASVYVSRRTLAAALDGPKDHYDCMDDATIAVHGAVCESSPEECVEWRGPCVRAMEAARAAILGSAT